MNKKKLGLKNELAAMSAVSCGVFLIAEPQRMSQFVSWKEKQTVSSHSHMREQISCQTVRDELYERFRGRLIAIPCEGSNVLAVAAWRGQRQVRMDSLNSASLLQNCSGRNVS